MKHPFWLNDRQWKKLEALLPLDARRRRVDDRRIISGIMYVIKNGLQWNPKAPNPAFGILKTSISSVSSFRS